jgi:RNA polymerase sigma-70 factor (ECF subfamily)
MQAINTYGTKLYNIAFFILKDEALAEDSTQDTFKKIWLNLDRFSFKSSLYTWMYRIAYNTALTTYHKEKKHRTVDTTYDPSSVQINNIEEITLKDAIEKLPLNYREAIIMYYFLRYSIKDISVELSVNENTIKSWLKRGRSQLKGYLDEK